MTTEEAWDYLLETGIVHDEQTLVVATSINGYHIGTLEGVLQAITGRRTFEGVEEDGVSE